MSKANALRTPDVHIVADTNALYSDSVDRLLSKSLSDFILLEARPLGVVLQWHLPAVVITERKQQMLGKGLTLLESVEKLETLIDHKMGYTEDTIRLHIDKAVERQMESHSLRALDLESARVNWDSVIDAAARKLPPYSSGGKEKGFKDAVILETFMQLAEGLPRSPTSCRVFLLTNDGALGEATRARVKGLRNVGVLNDLDALRTELNAVAAHLSPDAISKLVDKAQIMFFNEPEKSGLYYKWEIAEEFNKKYSAIASERPDGFLPPSVKMNYISPPTFLRKEGQKVFFSSKIRREVTAKKRVFKELEAVPASGGASDSSLASLGFASKWSERAKLGLLEPSLWEGYEEVEKTGAHTFEVHWCATLNRQGRLISPHLTSVEHIRSAWAD